jgi:hypothetical protein
VIVRAAVFGHNSSPTSSGSCRNAALRQEKKAVVRVFNKPIWEVTVWKRLVPDVGVLLQEFYTVDLHRNQKNFARGQSIKMTNIYDAIKEKENQIAIFQAQISGLQAEIEALRVAARIMEGGNGLETPRPVAVQAPAAAGGDKNKRGWP